MNHTEQIRFHHPLTPHRSGAHPHSHEPLHVHHACGCGGQDDLCDPAEEHVPVIHAAHSRPALFRVTGLDCANCAAKLERALNELPEVEEATLTFTTGQLRVWGREPQSLLPQLQAVAAKVEPEAEIALLQRSRRSAGEEAEEEEEISPLRLAVGGAVYVLTLLVLPEGAVKLAGFLAAYLLLGFDVVKKAVSNAGRGQLFDENFLMTLATIGAFCIGEYPEAVGVMLFYQIGETFEDMAVRRSRSHIMQALDLRPESVLLRQADGSTLTIPAEDAQPGDVIQLRPGDRVPLDGSVLSGESQLDTSPVTGEPVPVSVCPGDEVISGCVNLTGALTVQVEQPLESSMVTRILESVENAAASKPRIDRFITRFSRIYTPVVVLLAVLAAVIPSLMDGNWQAHLKTACTFLVISCPCALVLSVPLAFFAGIGAASRQKILFKGGAAMELLSKVDTVVFDKTGTVTHGTFALQRLLPAPGVEEAALLTLAASCEQSSTHPIAKSILSAAKAQGAALLPVEQVTEHPGRGVACGTLLCGSRALLEDNGISVPVAPPALGTEVLVAKEGQYLGQLVISDRIKDEAKETVAQLKRMNRSTAMLTGDSAQSACAVAQEVGIQEVHAGLLPHEKLEAIQAMRRKGRRVLFVGDGINDAPVLAGADVGAAMGSGADAAIEAADVVCLNGNLSAVTASIRISSESVRAARENVIFALGVKLLVILTGLMGRPSFWLAVFADSGVALLCVCNSIRVLLRRGRN